MINEENQPYVLWKEEKTNVEEVKVFVENLKRVESIKKEYNFRQILIYILNQRQWKEADIEVLEITPVSQFSYIFIIYHRIYRFRFRINANYNIQTKKVTVEKTEEVFSTKLQDIKEPETS